MIHLFFSCGQGAGFKPPYGNEFIRGSINSTHARRRVRKDQFKAEKQGKGRKFGAVREQVPRKQGLKQHYKIFVCV